MTPADLPVLKRLIPSIRKRIAQILWPTGYGVIQRDGALFLINIRNWAELRLLTHGVFEQKQLAYLIENIRDRACEVFLDIGANMGAYSIFVAKRTPCKTIIAFEPDCRSFDRLHANLLLNGLSEVVEARPVAASDHNGSVPFVYGPDQFDAVSKVGSGPQSRPVACVRLDDALTFSGQRIALKVDVENHEIETVAGMASLLRMNDCFLQIECFDDHFSICRSKLGDLGYQLIHEIGPDKYFARAPESSL